MQFVYKCMYQKNITPQIAGSLDIQGFLDGKIW